MVIHFHSFNYFSSIFYLCVELLFFIVYNPIPSTQARLSIRTLNVTLISFGLTAWINVQTFVTSLYICIMVTIHLHNSVNTISIEGTNKCIYFLSKAGGVSPAESPLSPAKVAPVPSSSSSMRSNALYLATRSLRAGAPVLI